MTDWNKATDFSNFYTYELQPCGKVIHYDWIKPENWDDEAQEYTDEGYYDPVPVDVIDIVQKRSSPIGFASGVTLNSVFKFLDTAPDVADMIFDNCWIKNQLDYWRTIDQSEIKDGAHAVYSEDEIEWLEVYWATELSDIYNTGTKEISIYTGFHGIGFELQEDKKDGDYILYNKGTRIHWGIDFVPLKDLLGMPIKLNEEFIVYEDWHTAEDKKNIKELVRSRRKFTLYEAIHAVMWELSFYGSEENKQAKKAELDASLSELQDENGNMLPIEVLEASGKVKSFEQLKGKKDA